MSDTPISLRATREDTIDALCRQFAEDALSMPELERRLTRAREARTRDELNALLSDLPGARVPAPTTGPGSAPATPREATSTTTPAARARADVDAADARGTPADGRVRTSSSAAVAILGGTRRAGRWAPPQAMVAVAVMGGVELDFRHAVLAPGRTTDINCFAFWGGIEIIVPPDVYVDTHGFALLGAFEERSELDMVPPPDAPVIRVNGFALMGGVEVKVRQRGGK